MRRISKKTSTCLLLMPGTYLRGVANSARLLPIVTCVLAIGGCRSDREASDEGTAHTTVTVITSSVRELGYEYDAPARHLLYLPLVRMDEEGEIRGRLARS